MASQQINLYLPIFRGERQPFSAQTLLYALGGVAVALMLYYGYASWSLGPVKKELASAQQQHSDALKRLEALGQQAQANQKDAALEQEVARLSAERDAKQQVLNNLTGGGLGNTKGFSAQIEGLARRRVDGVWLTNITISEGGASFALNGGTLAPELVPVLLQALGKEPVFKGVEFKTLLMERSEKEPGRVNFTLRTGDTAPAEQGASPPPADGAG
ncbi:MAG: PilN domain-containing protein [Gammaproteobacteria bacterium]|nr:PilN domain-containing protein [Gammaproteobacteria bacterium]